MTNHESWPNPATCEVNDNKHILILKKYLKIIQKRYKNYYKACKGNNYNPMNNCECLKQKRINRNLMI